MATRKKQMPFLPMVALVAIIARSPPEQPRYGDTAVNGSNAKGWREAVGFRAGLLGFQGLQAGCTVLHRGQAGE